MASAPAHPLRRLAAVAVIALVLLALAPSAGAETGVEPALAVDKDGNAVYAWTRTDTTNDIVRGRERDAAGNLTPAHAVSEPGRDSSQAQVTLDGQGRAYYVWARDEPSAFVIQTRVRNADGTLTPVQDLSSTAASEQSFYPQVAVDSQGTATYVWERFDGNTIIQGRRRAPNGTLTPVQDLSVVAADNVYVPQVGVDAQGLNAFFVWTRNNGTNLIVQYRRWAGDGTLGAVQNLSAAGQEAGEPQVAVDPQSGAHFVWTRSNGTADIVQTRYRQPAGGLTAVQDLSVNSAIDPQLSLDSRGNATYVWTIGGAVQTRRRKFTSGLLSGIQTVTSAPFEADPQVAVDPSGDAAFTWSRDNSGGHVVQTRRRTAEGLLSDVQGVSAVSADAEGQQVAVDQIGDAYFVWERADVIQTRVRETDGTRTSVQNLSVP